MRANQVNDAENQVKQKGKSGKVDPGHRMMIVTIVYVKGLKNFYERRTIMK